MLYILYVKTGGWVAGGDASVFPLLQLAIPITIVNPIAITIIDPIAILMALITLSIKSILFIIFRFVLQCKNDI